jgi:formylglycine-generating enzyme
MIRVPGGTLQMGSVDFYPEEGPVHEREVAPFELDEHPVSNAQFGDFVSDTGYVTVAEREVGPLAPDMPTLAPGSMVFTPSAGPVDLQDWRQWWRWETGANWRQPFGPGSSIDDRIGHPVVQVAFEDAATYAAWAGKRLPTEAELEWAARGGLVGARYAWGDEAQPAGRLMANIWQGSFPYLNTGAEGWVGTSPVGTFPANGYGLYDLIGNVWEWTSDYWLPRHEVPGSSWVESGARANLMSETPAVSRRVLKGGSHLCAPEYCLRYRPAARSAQAEDTSTTHIGFRCAR